MEKILINKQSEKTRIEIFKLEKMCEKLNNKFIPQFNELGICEITLELLQDAFFNKSAKIIELVNLQAEPEIKKAKNAAIKAMPSGASMRPSIPDKKNKGIKLAMMIKVE